MEQDANLTPELVEEVASRGGLLVTKIPMSLRAIDMFWDKFTCQECGVCCTGDYVGRTDKDGIATNPSEMERLASYLLTTPRAFRKKHTFHTGETRAIIYPCPFYILEEKICSIYQNRPVVCVTFPINQAGWVWIAGIKIYLLTISLNCLSAKSVALELIDTKITKGDLIHALEWQTNFRETFGAMD